jgi:hypothetical protein
VLTNLDGGRHARRHGISEAVAVFGGMTSITVRRLENVLLRMMKLARASGCTLSLAPWIRRHLPLRHRLRDPLASTMPHAMDAVRPLHRHDPFWNYKKGTEAFEAEHRLLPPSLLHSSQPLELPSTGSSRSSSNTCSSRFCSSGPLIDS